MTAFKHTIFYSVLIILMSLASSLSVSARIFTDIDGKTIEAELRSAQGDEVRMQRRVDGKTYSVPIEKFSVKDQSFIRNEIKAGRLTLTAYEGLNVPTVSPVVKSKLHVNATQQIDQLWAEYLTAQGVEPAPFVDDATFLRRAYLKIIGRIPTHAEAVHFLSDETPAKRSRLIDKLLDSPGYVSHNFNLWADVLRVKTTGKEGSRYGGVYYVQWLKEQIRQNVPYDEFVASLITAEGYPWDNPATAYYLRDFGMPLDNMSMTAQVFLGTQLQCAQCHDHPTDTWTQKQFYELSAFTYGIDTRVNMRASNSRLSNLYRELRRVAKEEEGANNQAALKQSSIMNAAKEFFRPMTWGVVHTDRSLKLPHDYQYEDAMPKDVVHANALYGDIDVTKLRNSAARVDGFADWMVSENNERFTKVIANRMWKHAMGKGLIEPVDNLTAESVAESPELMAFLESLMKSLDYDLKQYLRIVYNSQLFQREAVIDNPDLDDDYHFEGPTFQRMTSEQIWDSIATLMTPDIDSILQQSYKGRQQGIQYESDKLPGAAAFIADKSDREVVTYIKDLSTKYEAFNQTRTEWNKVRNDPKLKRTDEYMKLRAAFQTAQSEWNAKLNPKNNTDSDSEQMGMTSMMSNIAMLPGAKKNNRGAQQKWMKSIRRASELESPQANGHLLEVFGQSDRMLIENSDDGGNVLQALFLMNSWQINGILANNSSPVVEARLAKTPEEKIETLYIGFLSRKPTQAEVDTLVGMFKENPEKARQRMIWAMLNTQQFLFIQ
ncbi:MAG: DUF1549 domain-containing protein [Opitutaceae bacterium]